jgi:uncharacterized membrane protein HdeD (DUF308 family)
MNEEKQKSKRTWLKVDLSSTFWKTFLTLLSAVLIFAGPTYGVYAVQHVLKRSYAFSMLSGFALLIVGLALMWYLIRKKVFS